MSSSTEDGDLSTRTIVFIGAVVLVAAGALWWVRPLIIGPAQGDASPRGDTALVTSDATQRPNDDSSGAGKDQSPASTGCTVTVLPTSVLVTRTPTGINAGYARAESGEYVALDYKVVQSDGNAQGWYKLKVGDKKGWIKHNSLTVLESGSCPP
jgi:hypothetical protein